MSVPVAATITDPGEPGQHYGEPRAMIHEGRHAGRVMPMGWNAGQRIPVGTTGLAEYVSTSYAGLWRFTPDEEG